MTERITISCAPKIWLSQFKSLNPHASVTFTIEPGETIEDQTKQHVPILRRSVFVALLAEINFTVEAMNVLDTDETPEKLRAWCEEKLHGQPISIKTEKAANSQGVVKPGPKALPKAAPRPVKTGAVPSASKKPFGVPRAKPLEV